MTERPTQTARSRQLRFGAPAVVWGSMALFLALLAALAMRAAAGQDPALHARAANRPAPARRVLVRRIYERRVVVHLPAGAPPQQAQSSQQQLSAAGSYAATPVTRTS